MCSKEIKFRYSAWLFSPSSRFDSFQILSHCAKAQFSFHLEPSVEVKKKSMRLICFQWTTDTWAMNQSYARADFLLSFLSSLLPWNLWKLMIFGSNSVFVCARYDVREVHTSESDSSKMWSDDFENRVQYPLSTFTWNYLLHFVKSVFFSCIHSMWMWWAKNSLKRSDFSSRNWRDWLSDEIN